MKKIPLIWLQAFEAAGRLGSFKAAAQELNVSPSNISHQIRDLESYLQTPLFNRRGRDVKLTQEGFNYLPDLTAGFERLKSASPQQSGNPPKPLRIGAFPFLANEIITPNINSLTDVTGCTELQIFTRTELTALTHVDPQQRVDLVVRYGKNSAKFPGLISHKIADVALVPIVGPQLNIKSVDEFLQQPLIKVIGPFAGWERWLQNFAPNQTEVVFSLQTDSFHAAMLSVARNEGVCLGVLPYLSPWIREGKVCALPNFTLPIEDQAAYAVYAPFQQTNTQLTKSVEWLISHLN